MARTAPRVLFGVHGCTPYNRTTGIPYGELRVIKGSSLSLQGELVELMGGASKYPWAVEEGAIAAELSLNVGQFEDFMIQLFLGKAPTSVSTEATGNVSTLTNKYGAFVHATTGIASVALTVGDSADLKFGKYICIATTDDDFDVYFMGGADIGRGTNGTFISDAMKITSAPLAMGDSSATVVMADWGLTFTGGSGTVALTVGDTATFEVRPPHTGGMTVTVGGVADQTFPEFGALLQAQKRGNQEMFEIDIFRLKAAGMPIPFEMGAFGAYEIKAKAMYDETLDGILSMRHVKPSAS